MIRLNYASIAQTLGLLGGLDLSYVRPNLTDKQCSLTGLALVQYLSFSKMRIIGCEDE